MRDADLSAELRVRAADVGLTTMGIAEATSLTPEAEQLDTFLRAGRHGQMAWLEKTAAVRLDPRHPGMVEGALSVVVFATPYARGREREGPSPGRIARYARGRDYHNVLSKRLRKLERWLRAQGHETRHSVDSRPVLERAWAERAGIGFIGKNSCLIIPGIGSHVFLSCLVTHAPLVPTEPTKRRCGDCTLCLDACPTDAFVGARQLDARKCISYLTIEHEGVIDDSLKEGMGDWLLGCDVCQDVCPYNRRERPLTKASDPFAVDPRWGSRDAAELFEMDADTYAEWTIGTPMRRPGRDRMVRNVAIMLGHHGDKRHLPVLQHAQHDPNDAVRDAANWAVAKLEADK